MHKDPKFWFFVLLIPIIGNLIGIYSTPSATTFISDSIANNLNEPISVQSYYRALTLPSYSPPSWVFAPVWTILYLMLGVVSYLLWRAPAGHKRNLLLMLFSVQLLLNFIWSPIFFVMQDTLLALIDIILLLVNLLILLIVLLKLAKQTDSPLTKTAKYCFYLLLPYFCWITFATWLNIVIYQLNG